MKETSSNNGNKIPKTLMFYYGIAILVILFFNLVIMPKILSYRVQTTTYFDFMNSVESGDVKEVYISDTEINYMKEIDGQPFYFKTGIVDNPQLPQILQEKAN